MKKPTKQAMLDLIEELRDIAPQRPLTYGESLQVARMQAAHVREWADAATTAEINLLWLVEQKAVPVHFVASHVLDEESGVTTDRVGGKLRMFINQNEPGQRQRFSLLHEFKHALDFPEREVLHANLGTGDGALGKQMIEWVANEFAGHVLMPTALVRSAWSKCHSLSLMAGLFNVSLEAMKTRLEKLNLIGEPKPIPRA